MSRSRALPVLVALAALLVTACIPVRFGPADRQGVRRSTLHWEGGEVSRFPHWVQLRVQVAPPTGTVITAKLRAAESGEVVACPSGRQVGWPRPARPTCGAAAIDWGGVGWHVECPECAPAGDRLWADDPSDSAWYRSPAGWVTLGAFDSGSAFDVELQLVGHAVPAEPVTVDIRVIDDSGVLWSSEEQALDWTSPG